jgi:hypothetical protein
MAACAAALCVPLFVPLLSGRLLTFDDLARFHIPTRWLYARALSAGDAIWWTPDLLSGFYLHGEGQVGMLHPLHLILYSTLPFTPAFTLDIAANYLFATAGGMFMLRRFGFSWAAAWLGAFLYAFSGFNLTHLIHINMIAVVAHLPWLMAAAHAIAVSSTMRQRLRASLAMALLLGSAFLMGFPQGLLWSAIVVGAFVLWHVGTTRDLPVLGWVTLSAAAGMGLGAIQLLPMVDVAAESFRSDVSTAFATSFSLHPYNLLQLVSPYLFPGRAYVLPGEHSIHESTVYGGALCTLSIVYALARGRAIAHRRLVWAALIVGGAALVLALGRHAGVYLLLAQLPVFGSFRAPARFILLLHFAMAIVAAAVFDDLKAWVASRPHNRPTILFGVIAATVFVSAGVSIGGVVAGGGGAVKAAQSLSVFAATGALLALAVRGWPWAIVLLPIVAAVDLGAWGYFYVWREPPASLARLTVRADRPPGRPGDLVYAAEPSNSPVLAGYRVANGYVALMPRRAVEIDNPIAQRLAGVDWRKTLLNWEFVPEPMPRARIVHEVSVARRNVGRAVSQIDLDRSVVVPLAIDVDAVQGADEVRVVDDRPGRITISLRTSGRGVLVITERYHEGWRAQSADGRVLPVSRANGDFLGCVVDPGISEVRLTFAPRSLRVGAWISAATLGMCLLAVAVSWRRGNSLRTSRSDVSAMPD